MINSFKYFLYIFLPWAIVLSAFFTYFYLSEAEKENTLRLQNESLNVRMGKQAINLEFQAVMSDLLILAKHNGFYTSKRLLSLDAFRTLQKDFSHFSEMKGVYDQIRYINKVHPVNEYL